MYKDKTICVIIPAYNEELLITRTITTIPEFVDYIVVVDDGSKDKTVEKVKKCQKKDKRVQLFQHEKNMGAGSCAVTAYKKGYETGADIVVLMDGDAQMNPDDLDRIIDPVADGEAEYSKGNRFVIPIWKYFGNIVLSWLTRLLTGYKINDCQGNYAAIDRETLKKLNVDNLYHDYGFVNDILYKLSRLGARVKDVTTTPIYGIGEVTGITLKKQVPRISWLFIRMFWRKINGRS